MRRLYRLYIVCALEMCSDLFPFFLQLFSPQPISLTVRNASMHICSPTQSLRPHTTPPPTTLPSVGTACTDY